MNEKTDYTKPIDLNRTPKKIYTKAILGISICLVIFFLLKWDQSQGFDENREIKENELTEIHGTVSNDPKIRTSKRGSSLTIKIDKFPRFKFQIDKAIFRAMAARSFVEDVKKGDSIFCKILTYDYETKINKTKKARISERIFNYRFIRPYEIRTKESIYMKLSSVNNEVIQNEEIGNFLAYYIAGIVGFFGLIYFILWQMGVIKWFKQWWRQLHANH